METPSGRVIVIVQYIPTVWPSSFPPNDCGSCPPKCFPVPCPAFAGPRVCGRMYPWSLTTSRHVRISLVQACECTALLISASTCLWIQSTFNVCWRKPLTPMYLQSTDDLVAPIETALMPRERSISLPTEPAWMRKDATPYPPSFGLYVLV